jgi:hypothetical protein
VEAFARKHADATPDMLANARALEEENEAIKNFNRNTEEATKNREEFESNLSKAVTGMLEKAQDPIAKLKEGLMDADRAMQLFGSDAADVEAVLSHMVGDFVKANSVQKEMMTPVLQFGGAAEFGVRVSSQMQATSDGGAALVESVKKVEMNTREQTRMSRQMLEAAKKLGLLTGP